MFKFENIQSDNFINDLELLCDNHFQHSSALKQQLKSLSLMSFAEMAKSDSLFFSLDYTIKCASVALDVVKGLAIRDGLTNEEEFRNILCSSLFAHVGIIRGILPKDHDPSFLIAPQKTKEIPNSETDSALWRYCAERSALYVEQNLPQQKTSHMDVIERAIRNTDFTKQVDESEINNVGKITRACQIIALFSSSGNSGFNSHIVKIYLSAKEGNVLNRFRLYELEDFRAGFKQYFWDYLFSSISDTISILQVTDSGFQKIAKLYTFLESARLKSWFS